MSEMKQCHACGEEIKSIAKRCSHCQTWQSKWRIEPSDPRYAIIWVVIMLVIFGGMYFKMGFWGKKDFQDYASKLFITDSSINYGSDNCGSFVSVIGKIKNNTDVAWEDVYFEVQFFNSDNKLIDTISDNDYSLVMIPKSESTFKVRGKADHNKEAYKNFKIIVKKARESKNLF